MQQVLVKQIGRFLIIRSFIATNFLDVLGTVLKLSTCDVFANSKRANESLGLVFINAMFSPLAVTCRQFSGPFRPLQGPWPFSGGVVGRDNILKGMLTN